MDSSKRKLELAGSPAATHLCDGWAPIGGRRVPNEFDLVHRDGSIHGGEYGLNTGVNSLSSKRQKTVSASDAQSSSPELPVCLLVPESSTAVISKGGATIKSIEKTTNTRVHLIWNALPAPELAAAAWAAGEAAGLGSPIGVDKILCVRGSSFNNAKSENGVMQGQHGALTQLLPLLDPVISDRCAVFLLIPQRSVGFIVGQKGKMIESLSARSKSQIQVVNGKVTLNGDRCVLIAAPSIECVVDGVKVVIQQLQQLIGSNLLTHADFYPLINICNEQQSTRAKLSSAFGKGSSQLSLFAAPSPPSAAGGRSRRENISGDSYAYSDGTVASMGALGVLPPGATLGYGNLVPLAVVPRLAPLGNDLSAPCSGFSPEHLFPLHCDTCGGSSVRGSLCFVVNKSMAAWIVGQGGLHIRGLREATGATVQVSDKYEGVGPVEISVLEKHIGSGKMVDATDGSEDGVGLERFCNISGHLRSVCSCILRLVLPMAERLVQQQKPLRLLVSSRVIAQVIGPKGATVREIQSISGASVLISKNLQKESNGGGVEVPIVQQQRLIWIEGDVASRMVACAMVLQRLIMGENTEAARGGSTFLSIPALVADLQQAGISIQKLHLPWDQSIDLHSLAKGASQPVQLAQSQDLGGSIRSPISLTSSQSTIHGGTGSHSNYTIHGHPGLLQQRSHGQNSSGITQKRCQRKGISPHHHLNTDYDNNIKSTIGDGSHPDSWNEYSREDGPYECRRRPPENAWARSAAESSTPGQGNPGSNSLSSLEDLEYCFRSICSRFLTPEQQDACANEQVVKLMLTQRQADILLRREQNNGGMHTNSANALDKVSELTGCYLRCFLISDGSGSAEGSQMVLVLTGSAISNSVAVLLIQARLAA